MRVGLHARVWGKPHADGVGPFAGWIAEQHRDVRAGNDRVRFPLDVLRQHLHELRRRILCGEGRHEKHYAERDESSLGKANGRRNAGVWTTGHRTRGVS